jgi:hypothetical protein
MNDNQSSNPLHQPPGAKERMWYQYIAAPPVVPPNISYKTSLKPNKTFETNSAAQLKASTAKRDSIWQQTFAPQNYRMSKKRLASNENSPTSPIAMMGTTIGIPPPPPSSSSSSSLQQQRVVLNSINHNSIDIGQNEEDDDVEIQPPPNKKQKTTASSENTTLIGALQQQMQFGQYPKPSPLSSSSSPSPSTTPPAYSSQTVQNSSYPPYYGLYSTPHQSSTHASSHASPHASPSYPVYPYPHSQQGTPHHPATTTTTTTSNRSTTTATSTPPTASTTTNITSTQKANNRKPVSESITISPDLTEEESGTKSHNDSNYLGYQFHQFATQTVQKFHVTEHNQMMNSQRTYEMLNLAMARIAKLEEQISVLNNRLGIKSANYHPSPAPDYNGYHYHPHHAYPYSYPQHPPSHPPSHPAYYYPHPHQNEEDTEEIDAEEDTAPESSNNGKKFRTNTVENGS